jgi:ABC-type transport system substrate-binding protein
MGAGRLIRTAPHALLVAALLATAACTDDDAGPPETTASTVPERAVDGGTIRLGLGGPLVVDPVEANPGSPAELMVLDLLHDGLTTVDADGEVEPGVARTWEADATFTTWTVELDPDATFTDGRPITAEDVVASHTRVAAAGPASLAALRLEAEAGYNELVAGSTDALAGVTAADEGTVEIRTVAPLATLPAILAAPEMGVVDAEALDAVDGAEDIPGLPLSGGWSVDEADDDVVTLSRRTGPDGGHLAGAALHTFRDASAAYEAFEEDEVDWALVPGAEHDAAVEAHGDDHFAPFHAEVFLGMRVAAPPLEAAPLRAAIAAAIDREALVADVYADVADPLTTVVPVGVPGHDPGRCGSEPACGYDPEAAEAALADAYPDGAVPTVAVDFDDTERQVRLAEAVAGYLEEVGIPVELRPRPREEYRAFVTSGDQQLFSLGWVGGYASPDAYLAPLFASVADDNLTGVASPPIDKALLAARATEDPEEAAAQWASAERRILSVAVVVPIAQFRTQAVVAPRVQGLAHRLDGSVDWSAVWLADAGDGA